MKKLTIFKKQLIAIACLLIAVVGCFAAYAVFSEQKSKNQQQPLYDFTEAEIAAIKAFKGNATFTFKAEMGEADDKSATLMRLAEGYASVNKRIKVEYGKGDNDCCLTVNGKTVLPDTTELFRLLDDGTAYASDARAFFNKALFGSPLGATTDALAGYDLDGDKVNKAGYAYLYGPIDRDDIKYIYVVNEFDELTFIPYGNSFLLADTDMELSTSVSSTLVAAVRAPVAMDKVKNPASLNEYGLDSNDNTTATILMQDNSNNAYFIRIGDRLPDGTGYYALCEGKDIVYILPNTIANYLLIPKEKFLIANFGTSLSQPNEVFTKVNDITINFGDDLVKAEFMSTEEKLNHPINYTWKITAPQRLVSEAHGYTLPNYGNIGDVYNIICSLTSEDVLEAEVDDESLKKYGLDTPYRSYSWLYDGTLRCTVYFSKPNDDGDYYVYSTKENVKTGDDTIIGIALVSGEKCPFIGYKVLDYLDTELYTQYFDRLDYIEFTRNGKYYKLSLTQSEEGAVESAKLNGRDVDLDSCKNFYRGLLNCSIIEEYTENSERPKETFNIKVTSGGITTEISFGRISAMKEYCIINGKSQYIMDYNLYEILVSGADKLIAGEKVEW